MQCTLADIASTVTTAGVGNACETTDLSIKGDSMRLRARCSSLSEIDPNAFDDQGIHTCCAARAPLARLASSCACMRCKTADWMAHCSASGCPHAGRKCRRRRLRHHTVCVAAVPQGHGMDPIQYGCRQLRECRTSVKGGSGPMWSW